jgi:hypothetical protein
MDIISTLIDFVLSDASYLNTVDEDDFEDEDVDIVFMNHSKFLKT